MADEARAQYAALRLRFGALGGATLLTWPMAAAYVWFEVGATAQTCAGIGALGAVRPLHDGYLTVTWRNVAVT